MEIIIDLGNCNDKLSVLLKLGEILKLGGPNGNIPVQSETRNRGWGINWDALSDSLRYLDKGGIWGTSPKMEFPIKLTFINYLQFKSNSPDDYKTLVDILKKTKDFYSRSSKGFGYIFR